MAEVTTAALWATEQLPAPGVLALSRVALFADLDGTLAPIEATPDGVGPDAGRRRLLDALSRGLSGRLAVISGRTLTDLDRLLEGRVKALGAVHGLVRRTARGTVDAAPANVRTREALDAFLTFAEANGNLPVEDKGPAVALHYRGAPRTREACVDFAQRLATRLDLVVQEGAMVVELRQPGADKGEALAAFMREAPFSGYTPVFIGDDLTDESGFRAARAHAGFGVIVGSRRPTAATCALADVPAARDWLAAAVEASK